jgi:hypothetical protein
MTVGIRHSILDLMELLRRILRAGLVVLLGLEAAYLFAANAVLDTPLRDRRFWSRLARPSAPPSP